MKKPAVKGEAQGDIDEFLKRETKTISKAEYDKRNEPYETQQELLRLLDAWRNNAQSVIEKSKDKRAAADAQRIIEKVNNVYRLLFGNDKCRLVLEALDLGLEVMYADLPELAGFAMDREGKRRSAKGGGGYAPLKEHKAALLSRYQALQAQGIEKPNKSQLTLKYLAEHPELDSGSYDRLRRSLPKPGK